MSSLHCRIGLAMVVFSAAAAVTSRAAAAPTVIEIQAFAFVATEITIAPGTTVEWVNHDQTPHNIVSTDGVFASPGLDTDDRFAFAFTREGDFTYYCALHPFMKGVVHVRRDRQR